MADIQSIAAIPYFRGLTQDQQASLAAIASIRTIPRSTILFRPGEPRKTFFVVLSGQVRVYSLFNGEVQTLALLEPGDFAVESALVNPAVKHDHYGEMASDGEVLEIDGKAFLSLGTESPAIASAIYGQIVLNLTERLHHANNKLVTIYATGKIASTYDSLDNLSELLLTTILSIIKARRGLFVLYKPLEGKAIIREARGYGSDQKVKNLDILIGSDPILGDIYNTGSEISITEAMYKEDRRLHTPYASKSMLGVPLAIGQKVIGAILLGEKEHATAFSVNNRILLSIIARQVVSVIGTAEMLEEVR